MITLLAIFAQTLSLYALYNRSKRAELRSDFFSAWLRRPLRWTQAAAIALLVVSCWLLISVHGFGAGVFMAFISLMTATSLIVILSPLRS